MSAVELDNVSKVHGSGHASAQALSSVSLRLEEGEFLSIMGPSGCGKTTLLNLIAGLDHPTSGQVIVAGQNLSEIDEAARSRLRARDLGFIFQSFNLLPRLSVLDNVAWRLEDLGFRGGAADAKTREVLTLVGVPQSAWERYPSELSGGEQQRVSTARALVTDPKILLADEPTGNLDSSTGDTILALLRRLNVERRMSVVLVTHDSYAALYGHRTIVLRDGQIVEEVGSARLPNGDVVPFRARPHDRVR